MRTAIIAIPLALLSSACFDPAYGDGGARCVDQRECPTGYECVPEPETSFCRPESTRPPTIDQIILEPSRFKLDKPPARVRVKILLSNFMLEQARGQTDESHFGHYHLSVKQTGAYVALYADVVEIPFDRKDPKGLFTGLTAGSFELIGALAHHSQAALSPPVQRQVTLLIEDSGKD